jgi:hypothetical protein
MMVFETRLATFICAKPSLCILAIPCSSKTYT